MRLQQVTYRLFEHEVAQSWSEETHWHQLDGEVMLVGEEQARFISWCSEPVQYCIGTSSGTFFRTGVLQSMDVSEHPLWRKLIGSDVSTRFLDSDRQVLQIEGAGCSVYVSSQYGDGQFQGDCVRASATNPL